MQLCSYYSQNAFNVKYSIAYSPNGWTDTELAVLWLEKVFVPHIQAKHGPSVPVILQLDGQNSHTTYRFASLCVKYGIELVITPSHTTHCLQPCDVAVFSPLASAYKKSVNEASLSGKRINKQNLPSLYGKARAEAFKEETIKTAFRKAGIWPLDRTAIKVEAYEPSKDSSCHASMPIPVSQPELLLELEDSTQARSRVLLFNELPFMEYPVTENNPATEPIAPAEESQPSSQTTGNEGATLPAPQFQLVGLIPPLRQNATRNSLLKENQLLRELLEKAKVQIEADYALKLLMQDENERVRQQLYAKKTVDRKRAPGEGQARLMTSNEQLDALAKYDWKRNMEAVLHSTPARDAFKACRMKIKVHEDLQAEKKRAKELQTKEALKKDQQAQAARTKEMKVEERRKEREKTQERKRLEKLAEKARKASERKKAVVTKKALRKKPDMPSDVSTEASGTSSTRPTQAAKTSRKCHVSKETHDKGPVELPLLDKTVTQINSMAKESAVMDLELPIRVTRSTTRKQVVVAAQPQ